MPYTAILFDLDNTLYDYTAYWRARLMWSLAAVQAAYPALDPCQIAQHAIARRIYAADFDAYLAACGVADATVRAQAVARYRVNWYDQLELFAGAAELLERLHRCYRLGLITNGPAHSQRPKIACFGLEQWMQCCIISGEVGVAKPDPRIFGLALQQLRVLPQQAVYVGDSLEFDLRGASAAGIDFVWLNRQATPLPPDGPAPHAIISELTQLTQVSGIRCEVSGQSPQAHSDTSHLF